MSVANESSFADYYSWCFSVSVGCLSPSEDHSTFASFCMHLCG